MKASNLLGALLFLGLLGFFSTNLYSQNKKDVVDLGKIETIIDVPLTTGDFFDEEDIQETCCTNLAEFLTQKGYLVMNTGGTGSATNVSINGYAGFCIKVYIDDVLANNPTTGEFDWNQINLESIVSIEIQDFPVENQLQFAGVVIKIRTKSFGKNQFSSFSKITSYDSSFADILEQALNLKLYTKKSAFSFNADARYAKNEYLTPRNTVNLYNKSKLAQIDGTWNRYTDHGSLYTSGFVGYNSIKAPNTGDSYEVGVEDDINARFTLKRVFWGNKVWHTYGTNYTFVDVEYDQSLQIHNSTRVHNMEVFYNLDWKNSGFKLYNTVQNEWSATMKAWRPQLQTKLTYDKQFCSWFKLYASLGFDGWYTQSFDFDILPCVRFVFPYGLSAVFYKEFVLPTFNQLYWNGAGGKGNPDLESEYGWSGVFAWKQFELFSCTFQTSWYGNKIRWSSLNDEKILMPMNTANAWYFIGTAYSKKEWSWFGYDARLNFTRAMLEDGNQIMWVPFITGSLSLNFNYKNFDWCISGSYTGKRYKENDKRFGTYNPYFLLDLTQNYTIKDTVIITVKVANLLDDRYIYHDNYSAPGRSYSLAVRIKK